MQTIRDALPTQEGGGAKFCSPAEPDSVGSCLETFESVNSVVVRKVIFQMRMTQCLLDSCLSSLLRDSLPVITDILNVSLESEVVAHFFKKAVIRPLLKKIIS